MKTFTKFESMVTDDDREGSSTDLLPKFNPVVNLAAKEYVDELKEKGQVNTLISIITSLGKNRQIQIKKILELSGKNSIEQIGIKELCDNDIFPEIEEELIRYFTDNPGSIRKEIPMKTFKVNGGDGISRTNKLGGTSQADSPRVGESVLNLDKEVQISPDDMQLFNREEPLINLIRKGKVILGNNKIMYNSSDKETEQVLDIYLEIEGDNTGYVNIGKSNPGFENEEIDEDLVVKYNEAFLFDTFEKNYITRLVESTLNVCPNAKIKTKLVTHEVSEKAVEKFNFNAGKYQVLTMNISEGNRHIELNLMKSVSDYLVVPVSETNYLIESVDSGDTFICKTGNNFSGWKKLISKIFSK